MACVLEPEIDQPTAHLIVQLQLQDAALYSETCKGKSRDPTDEELAFQLQNEELESISQFLEDKRMAMSFATAVEADGRVLAEKHAEEENARKDRNIARQWTGEEFPMSLDDPESETAGLDDETLSKLQIMYMSSSEEYGNMEDTETEQVESSTWAARRLCPSRSRSRIRRCIACREETEFFNVARAPCQHEYCRSCLEDLFKASMTDESLFPPRCCRQPINMNIARIFLKSDIVQEYQKKKIEFETPNRTYCYSIGCSSFIDRSHINGEVATCPECQHTTCTNCKGRAHTGDCPNDTALQQLLATAQENGWQRCSSCWRMVELDHGCNHMTFVPLYFIFLTILFLLTESQNNSCLCGAQFCYNCGDRWKNCACEQWIEHRLLARAYQLVDREAVQLPAAAPPPDIEEPQPVEDLPAPEVEHMESQAEESDEEPGEIVEPLTSISILTPRDVLVARTVQELRDNHECRHNRWKFVPGPHRCEECSYHLPGYIFECHQCRLRACNRCRRNRL